MDIGGAAKLDGYKVYSSADLVATLSPDELEFTLDGLAITAG